LQNIWASTLIAHTDFLGDFGAFYCAARAVSHGADPYYTEPLRACEHSVVPRRNSEVNRRRAAAISEGHRRDREWNREDQSAGRDRAWFEREIMPNLEHFALNAIARATGLSLAACSRIRAGAQIPHPRHWEALIACIKGKEKP
jgi:hypothetical protein